MIQHPVELEFWEKSPDFSLEGTKGENIIVVASRRGIRQLRGFESFGLLGERNNIRWLEQKLANPTVNSVLHMLKKADIGWRPSLIIGFGGGSSIDAAKALSYLLRDLSRAEKFRSVLSSGIEISPGECIPLIAIPTTAGTGSEVTPFATIWDTVEKEKFSLSGPGLFPRKAIIHPNLVKSCPEEVLISCGLDALNQAFESLWNKNASEESKKFAERSIHHGFKAFDKLSLRELDDDFFKEISYASTFAGLAISLTRTAICHSISYPLTLHFEIPHGIACAFTMDAVFRRSRIAREISTPGNLLAGSPVLGSFSKVETRLREILLTYRIQERVQERVGTIDALTPLIPQMITPGRLDNFDGELDSIEAILRESWGL